MFCSRVLIAYLVFALYVCELYGRFEDSVPSLIKASAFSLLLFFSVFELAQRRFDLLRLVIKWAAICATVAALITIARYLGEGTGSGVLPVTVRFIIRY